VLGAWLHGRAGALAAQRLTDYGVIASDIAGAVPGAIGELLEANTQLPLRPDRPLRDGAR
jgi:hypothetical protein